MVLVKMKGIECKAHSSQNSQKRGKWFRHMIAGTCHVLLLLANIAPAQMDSRFVPISELEDQSWTTTSLNEDGCLVVNLFLTLDSVNGMDLILEFDGAISSAATITVGTNSWFASGTTSPVLTLIDSYHLRIVWALGNGEYLSAESAMPMVSIIICNPDDELVNGDVRVVDGGVLIIDVEPTTIIMTGGEVETYYVPTVDQDFVIAHPGIVGIPIKILASKVTGGMAEIKANMLDGLLHLNCSRLTPGLYVVQMKVDGAWKVFKLLVGSN